MMAVRIAVQAAVILAVVAGAQAATMQPLPPKPGVGEIVKESKASDWRALDPEHTLYMDLPAGRVAADLLDAERSKFEVMRTDARAEIRQGR
jgi:hypothetical protein